MDCSGFEKQLEPLFRNADGDALLSTDSSGRIDLDWVQERSVREHLAQCANCVITLARYLRLRDRVNLDAHPCIHLAFEIAEGDFVGIQRGYYMIYGKGREHWQKFIEHCPWCGIKVPKIYHGDLDDLYGSNHDAKT